MNQLQKRRADQHAVALAKMKKLESKRRYRVLLMPLREVDMPKSLRGRNDAAFVKISYVNAYRLIGAPAVISCGGHGLVKAFDLRAAWVYLVKPKRFVQMRRTRGRGR